VNRNKTHYEALKDDKCFNSCFVSTSHMHHIHLILEEQYVPSSNDDIYIFKETQTFINVVLEDHLKTDNVNSLVSHYKDTRDAQQIYRNIKQHALGSTAAPITGDTLLE
jgi:hypothetical protein